MGYLDEQGGSDRGRKVDGQSLYSEQESQIVQDQKNKGSGQGLLDDQAAGIVTTKSKKGILERVRSGLFGDKTLGEKAKEGYKEGKAQVAAGTVGGFENGASKVIRKLANPKALAGLVLGTGMGVFSLASIFSTYKNDDVIRNDPPFQCESGDLELPDAPGGGDDADVQDTVNILYDIFVNQFGYTESDLVGMVACMLVETGCDPDRLESDFVGAMIPEKEKFDAIAGPGTTPDANTAQNAYWAYGDAYRTGGGWNGASAYIADGHMCPGIGLIQWTGGRANNLIQGLDKVSMNVSPMDVQYQAAFLLAEATTIYKPWAPGGERTGNTDDNTATTNFFGTMVYGHMPDAGDDELALRLAQVSAARAYVDSASANSEFTMDAVTMAEELAEEGFNSAVSAAQTVQICVNSSYIITSDIANAAVSISWLERGDYEDVNGAYGSYRRDARSPIMVNDWNFIEGHDENPNTLGLPYNGEVTYGDVRPGSSDTKKTWRFYDIEGAPGKLDLIACTEYYYFAHLIAFPKETGVGDNAGYFSSCDRGTATAVRIAGADDKFPAGNPQYQLAWAIGAKKQDAHHNENARVEGQEAGALWKFSGFMRGSDWYSASGSASVPIGGVMISWSTRAANGLLGEDAAGSATAGDGGMLAGEDSEDEDGGTGVGWDSKAIQWACLRYPMSVTNTTRHIITYVGDSTVQNFWGLDWLYEQWKSFDDADRLIRKDLTETVPEIMTLGLSYKAKYAKDSSDQHMTFYKAKARGAQDNKDLTAFAPLNGRLVEFNSKTGLPEFRAWEQIYVRLIHNSDDDAATGTANGNQLYEWADPFGNLEPGPEGKGDGYLDLKEKEVKDSKIEQYDNENTYQNKYFYEDWNSLGIPKTTDAVKGDHKNDYKDPGTNLIWMDTRAPSDPLQWTHESSSAATSAYWRYELVTDIEYRLNQFLRFGMASMMCSYPSEEDADVYQTGGEGNDTGHILGNLYRRFSRIPDKVDSSGRYYYYNTVVSNDMLQDLVQLYVEEKNAYTEGGRYKASGGNGKDERNFGPMYLIPLGRVYSDSLMTTSDSSHWVDRRYGLTASDIAYIANGVGGFKMGEASADEIEGVLTDIVTEPMHKLGYNPSGGKMNAWFSLYDNSVNSVAAGAATGAHEGGHNYNDFGGEAPYETEIYGMDPFLMLESERYLNVEESQGLDKWEAGGTKKDKSVRNSVDGIDGAQGNGVGTEAKGIDPTSTDNTMDARLAWIDRHYFVTGNGGIGTFAYQVLALNPSTGSKVAENDYESALKNVKTVKASPVSKPSTYSDTLYSSWNLVCYTDYIYGDDKDNNKYMAKRLFGGDSRNGDDPQETDGARDDYNRRDFYVIPYYHTHAQQCNHDHLIGYDHYELLCRWQDNTIGKAGDNLSTPNTVSKIDTQVALNGNDGTNYQDDRVTYDCDHEYGDTYDYGDTISFNVWYTSNRDKYDMEQLLAALAGNKVRYFADTGDEIAWNAKPYIHVTCNGVVIDACCTGGTECPDCLWYHTSAQDDELTCTKEVHTHGSGCNTANCSKSPHTHGSGCDYSDCTVTDADHVHNDDCCNKEEHTHGKDCCSKTEHTHSYAEGCYTCNGHPSDCTDNKCADEHDCDMCNKVCPVCSEVMECGTPHIHSCADCIYYNYCHDHKECDDYGHSTIGDDPTHVAECTPDGWHGDGGNYDYVAVYGGNEYPQSDKCHYEYGCNALEFLYHNTDGADGARLHYRWTAAAIADPDIDTSNPPTLYDPNTMELYEVHAVYMAVPASTNADITQFDIKNWITTGTYQENDAVVCDKANLLQQVTYDNNGWVTRNWQDMIDGNKDGSLLKPLVNGNYLSCLVSSTVASSMYHVSGQTVGVHSPDDNKKGLLQYFTIEGNSIHRDTDWEGYLGDRKARYGNTQAEYDTLSEFNGTRGDLVALESIRNRVGYGKSVSGQSISVSEQYNITQTSGPGGNGSSAGKVQYESTWMTEGADADSVENGNDTGLGNHGWGEVAVVGTQHPKAPTDSENDYGNSDPRLGGDDGVSGPDGSLGNNILPFKSSLLREIIGDEHVVHVKFDVQDIKGLTEEDAGDNGRDFVYYVDKERAFHDREDICPICGNKWIPGIEDKSDLTPLLYQNPLSHYYDHHSQLGDFLNTGSASSGTNKYGLFKSMDMDTLYMNYYTGELTDKMYAKNVYPHEATDYKYPTDKEHPDGNTAMPPNMKNPPAKAGTSLPDGAENGSDAMKTLMTYKEQDSPNGTKVLNTGDYRNWVTHASRGNRGMMTQYLNFGTFFKDVYKAGDATQQDKNNAYMVFETVTRSDIMKNEDGGKDKYGYQMGSDDADEPSDREKTTKEEGFVYKDPPSDATNLDPKMSWGYGESSGFSDTYGQGSNSHWKNMMDLYNAAMSETRQYGY